MEVKNKVVVVTGGGSGIGAALCERFAREGAKGVAVADKNEANAKAVAALIEGGAFACDVTVEAEVKDMIAEVEQRLGPIDLFCSNAGVAIADPDVRDPAGAADEVWTLNWQVHV